VYNLKLSAQLDQHSLINGIFSVVLFVFRRDSTFIETYAMLPRKQLLDKEVKICYLHIYCVFTATLNFDIEPKYFFMKILQKYLKQPIQNGQKKS
jgi:hypothetical protein